MEQHEPKLTQRAASPSDGIENPEHRGLFKEHWALLAILSLALALRLYVWWQFLGYQLARDEVDYFHTALALYEKGAFVDPNPVWMRVPLFPVIAAGIFKLSGPSVAAVNLFQIAISLANLYLVYVLGRLAFGKRAGLIAAFLFAIFPPLITYPSSFFMTEPLFAFLTTALLLSAYYAVRRSSLVWAAGAGAMLGLACLTRPAALVFAPLLAAWFVYSQRAKLRLAVMSVAVVGIVAMAIIAPWTGRNYVEFHRFILLDTTGAYNLWLDNNYQQEDLDETLQAIENQGDRQAYATKRAIENITAHPVQFLTNGIVKMGLPWHLELDSYARRAYWDVTSRAADLGYALTADVLLLIVGFLAVLGLAFSGGALRQVRGPAVLLVLLWLVATIGPLFATHSEPRFRIAYLPQILIMAAVPLSKPGGLPRFLRGSALRPVLASALLIWVVAGAQSSWAWAALQSNYFVFRGDLVYESDLNQALSFYRAAIKVAPPKDPIGYDAAGDAYRLRGMFADAMSMYNQALKMRPGDGRAHLGMADALSQIGRVADAGKQLAAVAIDDTDRQSLGWRFFEPSSRTTLDVGNKAEAGSIIGFHAPEQYPALTYRWTGRSAALRFSVGNDLIPRRLYIHVSAPRPSNVSAPSVSIKVNGVELTSFTVGPDWETRELQVPPGVAKPGQPLVVEITSDTFVPARFIQGSTDTREVGVAVDWVRLGS